VSLTVDVMNNGNATVAEPASAAFYADESLSTPIGSVAMDAPAGCAQETVTATVIWDGLCAGTHSFWVRVSGGEGMTLADESGDVAAGTVVVESIPSLQTYLPLVLN
jgi:hypothetical protein